MKRMRFVQSRRQLVIPGFAEQPPHLLLAELWAGGYIEQEYTVVRRRGHYTLTITLAPHDNLPALNLLERLAKALAQLPNCRVVMSPWWETGGREINVNLALDLIGAALRRISTALHQRAA